MKKTKKDCELCDFPSLTMIEYKGKTICKSCYQMKSVMDVINKEEEKLNNKRKKFKKHFQI
jgi:hypothetical protein